MNLPQLWDRGRFWEIFGFKDDSFTALQLAEKYSRLCNIVSPEHRHLLDDAFMVLNAPLPRRIYRLCRGTMRQIREKISATDYLSHEPKLWQFVWQSCSGKWREPEPSLADMAIIKVMLPPAGNSSSSPPSCAQTCLGIFLGFVFVFIIIAIVIGTASHGISDTNQENNFSAIPAFPTFSPPIINTWITKLPEYSVISGDVMTASGLPVSHCTVCLVIQGAKWQYDSEVTDNNGSYSFMVFIMGTYELYVLRDASQPIPWGKPDAVVSVSSPRLNVTADITLTR